MLDGSLLFVIEFLREITRNQCIVKMRIVWRYARLSIITSMLSVNNFMETLYTAREATMDELLTIHSREHVEKVHVNSIQTCWVMMYLMRDALFCDGIVNGTCSCSIRYSAICIH
jgi:hypothetical protein